MLLADMALRPAQVTDATGAFSFSCYFAFRVLTSAAGCLLIVALGLGSKSDSGSLLVIVAVALSKAFESLADIVYGFFQRRERMDLIGRSQIIKSVFSVAVVSAILWFSHSLFGAVLAIAVVSLLVFIGYDLANARRLAQVERLTPDFEPTGLRKLLLAVWPLGLVMMLNSLSTNIPRYFVRERLGERELGFFAGLAYLIVVGNLLVSSLGQAASPRLANYHAHRAVGRFGKLVCQLTALATGIGTLTLLGAYFGGRTLLRVVYTPAYAEHLNLFLWLLLAGTIAYISSVLGFALTAARKFIVQPFIYGASASTALIGCYILVPRYGLTGAAWSVLSANIVALSANILCNLAVLRELQRPTEPLLSVQAVGPYGSST